MYPALCPRHGQARHPAERDILMISSLQLAAHARLPAVAAAFGTGDDQPAWQACTDGAFGALSAVAVSGSLLTGAGSLAGGRIFSPEQLVMDSEVFSWAARIGAGIRVDEEAIGLEVIKNVGIGGNFLGQRHTRRHMKDVWRPRLLDRSMWDAWMASGREGPYEKATGLCDTLLREHEVAPIEADAAGQLAKIVAGAGL
jgi:trimethylamine--corrinoid protein Co-methyltransferase